MAIDQGEGIPQNRRKADDPCHVITRRGLAEPAIKVGDLLLTNFVADCDAAPA